MKNIVKPQDFIFGHNEDEKLQLDCGRSFGPVNIRYETYGTLDKDGKKEVNINENGTIATKNILYAALY